MSSEFKLSDFDAPSEVEDHRVLLDAIRNAAASGVKSSVGPIVLAHNETQKQIAALNAQVRSMKAAEASLNKAQDTLANDRLQQLLICAFALCIVLAGAGIGWHAYGKPAKVVQVDRYCTDWNARKGVCNVDWKLPIRP